jgi:hypothetical protein
MVEAAITNQLSNAAVEQVNTRIRTRLITPWLPLRLAVGRRRPRHAPTGLWPYPDGDTTHGTLAAEPPSDVPVARETPAKPTTTVRRTARRVLTSATARSQWSESHVGP